MKNKNFLFSFILVVTVFLIAANFSYTVMETVFRKGVTKISEKKPLPVVFMTKEVDKVDSEEILTDEIISEEKNEEISLPDETSIFNYATEIDFLVGMIAEKCELSADYSIEEKRSVMMGLKENYIYIHKVIEIYSDQTLKKFIELISEFSLFNKIELKQKITPSTVEIEFYKSHTKIYDLVINKSVKKLQGHLKGKIGKLSIIVDDMGRGTDTSISFLSLPKEITLSFIPHLRSTVLSSNLAYKKGHTVMIHIPMETIGNHFKIAKGKGVTTSMSNKAIESYLNKIIAILPQAIGANNHMGSKATQNNRVMSTVMRVLKRKKLFFVDSKTTSRTVGWKAAAKAGIKYGIRDIFLDNTRDVKAISSMIDYACKYAKINGFAIAICHPHKETLKALKTFLKKYNKKDIILVPVSELVKSGKKQGEI